MRDATLTNREISWWLMGRLLNFCLLLALLVPCAAAVWIVLIDALDVEDINRRQRVAEAPRIAATMARIAALRPRPGECDIDHQADASCITFTKQGERRIVRVAGDQP